MNQQQEPKVSIRNQGATQSSLQLLSLGPDQAGAYRVIVSNPVGSVASVETVIELDIPTDVTLSDSFAGRQILVGNPSGTARADNASATVERSGGSQEPFHGGKKGGHSLWFTWKAPSSGVVTFDTRGSEIDTVLAVYTGSDLNALTMVRDADDHKDDDDDTADDTSDDNARKRRTFFAEAVRFEAVAGTEYHIAIDGFAGATGNVVINWNLSEVDGDLPQVMEDAGALAVGGGRRIVKPLGESVELRILGFGVALEFKWFHNGRRIPDANGPIYVIDSLTRDNVGVYQAEASNQDGSHKIRSKKFLVEIGSESNANTVNKLQDLDRNQGQQGRSGFARPANLIPVSAGALGTQVANNAQSSTQQDELLIANQLGGSSRWLQLQVTENTRMTVDTIGSSVDTLMAVYIPPQGVPLDELQFNQLDFVDSDDDGAPDGLRSLLADLPVSAQEYLIVVDGKNGATGDIQINYRLGSGPVITAQPAADASAAVGGQVSLSVIATGSPAPSYQWRFNGEAIDTASNPSAATATLTLPIVELSHSGNYSVEVSNHMETVTSQISKLTVGSAPVITQQPTIQQAGPFSAGDTITITVAATGEPAPSFRWRKDGQDLADGGNVSGSGTATLQIASAQSGDAGSYDVFIENTHGDATGEAVVVSLGSAPTLTLELTGQSQTVCEGDPAMFMVAASGSPTPTFEWRRDGEVVQGQTGATLTIASAASGDAGVYTVKAVNMHGEDVGATSATLTVNSTPSIGVPLPDAVLVDKGTALTLEIQATGATSYEWKLDDVVIQGETGSSLNLPAVQPANAGTYTVTAINDCGRSASASSLVSIRHLSSPNFANGKFGFQMDGSVGEIWIFDVALNGNLNVWTEVGRVTLDGAGVPVSVSSDPGETYTTSLTIQAGRVIDNASDSMQGARIYRIRMAP